MSPRRRPTTAAAALAVLALAAPTAAARPALDPAAPTTTHTPATITTAARDQGIEWGSTALGAGGTAIVFALAGAGLVSVSRRHHANPSARS